MNSLKPIMTVFAGTNGAGKSTISLQMRDFVGEVVDPDQIAIRLIPENPRIYQQAKKRSEESDL